MFLHYLCTVNKTTNKTHTDMKKLTYLLTALALVALPMALTSCDDDDDYYYEDNYYDLDAAVNDYLNQYGEFGTDDQTTLQWFNNTYYRYDGIDYYYNVNWNDFTTSLNNIYAENQVLMADYLCTSAWQGPMKVSYVDATDNTTKEYTCTVEYDFDRDSKTATKGRGKETRVNFSDGSADSEASFSWEVDGYGNIIFTLDDGFQMVLYYSDLSYLNDKQLEGIISSNTEGYNEQYTIVLSHVTYAKPNMLDGTATTTAKAKTFTGTASTRRTVAEAKAAVRPSNHR